MAITLAPCAEAIGAAKIAASIVNQLGLTKLQVTDIHQRILSRKRRVCVLKNCKRVLAETARQRWVVAAADRPTPMIANVRAEAEGYARVPIAYGDLLKEKN